MKYYIIFKTKGEIGFYEVNDLEMAKTELARINKTEGWEALSGILTDINR